MGVIGQRHASAALYSRGKDPLYPLDRRLGGPQSRSDAGARKKIPCPYQGLNPDCPACSQTLYCLSYCGSPDPVMVTDKHLDDNENGVEIFDITRIYIDMGVCFTFISGIDIELYSSNFRLL
jgi:hypothetical protein